jgi:4-alpha-glucanotransferase
MWAIFPIQDLLAIEESLKLEDLHAERINVPGNSNHYWRYRMHLDLEELLKEKDFNSKLKSMVTAGGR